MEEKQHAELLFIQTMSYTPSDGTQPLLRATLLSLICHRNNLTSHLAFLSPLQSFKKLFLSKEIEIVTLEIELLPTSDLFCLFSNISQNLTIYFFFRPWNLDWCNCWTLTWENIQHSSDDVVKKMWELWLGEIKGNSGLGFLPRKTCGLILIVDFPDAFLRQQND